MKKLLLAFLIPLIISCDKESEVEIYYGDLIINSQRDVPVGKRIITVTGDLIIQPNALNAYDINDLSALKEIRRVDGDVSISLISVMDNLDFLAGLREVGGEFGLYSNYILKNINGLKNLESVGSISIVSCHELNSIEPISNIKILNGGFVLQYNNFIKTFPAFKNIVELKGDLIIDNYAQLESLSGFSHLTKVNGDLKILGHKNKLINLSGLESLKEVGSTLTIGHIGEAGNKSLQQLTGLENLEKIGENLIIVECHVLNDLKALNKLQYIGGELYIDGNEKLKNLEGLNHISNVSTISIARNTELNNYCALKDLVEAKEFGLNDLKIFLNKQNPTKEQIINDCE